MIDAKKGMCVDGHKCSAKIEHRAEDFSTGINNASTPRNEALHRRINPYIFYHTDGNTNCIPYLI